MPEVEYTGWFSRLGKSFGGVVVGLILFVAAFPVLIWNEGRAVNRARDLSEGTAACVSVSADKVEEANDGKLVHITGDATTDETLEDPIFHVAAKALKLTRNVEIYQWVERSEKKTQKKIGGGEETITYYYHEKKWVKEPVNSSGFKNDDGPNKDQKLENKGTRPYPDEVYRAKEPKLGAFKLSNGQVDKLGAGEKLAVTNQALAMLSADLQAKLKVTADGFFYLPFRSDGSPSDPQIGDVRIFFNELKPQKVSVIAKQFKSGFEPWHSTAGGGNIDELRPGVLSKEAMFEMAQEENNILTWVLRLVGFLLMVFGICLVFSPLVVLVDVLPILGDFLSAGIGVAAFLIALPLTLITIAVAWIAYRPIIGIPLLAAGLGIIVLGFWLGRRRKAARRQAG